jgi:hypothetical protein
MTEYRVTWEIDVEADSLEEAAHKARYYQVKPGTTSDVLDVYDANGEAHRFDLTEIREEYASAGYFVEFVDDSDGPLWQSVFPEAQAELSQMHSTTFDAWAYLKEQRLALVRGQVAVLGDWSFEDQDAAQRDGWDLFSTGRGFLINRVDDMSDVRPSGVGEPVFGSDEEAVDYVRQLASKGLPIAIKAIAIHELNLLDPD